MALILISAKAACDNVADAGRGFKSPRPDWGPRTLLAVPLTPWTRVSSADREWFIAAREERSGREARTQTPTEQKLCSSENPAKKKKRHKCKDPSATCLNQHRATKMPGDLFCKTPTKKITLQNRLPDMFAIVMRYSVTVNKTLLFCLLVSQTTSFTSDPCCDPARRQRTIPQGCTALELSDVLI